MFNLTAEQSDQISKSLGRLDKAAQVIQENHKAWGIPFEQARQIVNALDQSADDIEKLAFGEESMRRRQVEVLKTARVIQRDGDEGYMQTFESVQGVIQADGDEPYMTAYKDDQSSAVIGGKDAVGSPLAPGHTGETGPQQGSPSA